MKYGFVLPWGDAATTATLAAEAERAGWDGFFGWEPVWGIDVWISLAAAAVRTEKIKLGTMLTPLSRRKPWDLAGQAATLDNLSGGRVILSVGLGAVHDGWQAFEPDEGRPLRAKKLDEGLAIVTGLWAGQPFTFQGDCYDVRPTDFMPPPPPVQQPRIPIWVVGLSRAPKSMRRVARWDGWLPNFQPTDGEPIGRPDPEQLSEGVAWLRAERASNGLTMAGFEVVVEGVTEPGPAGGRKTAEWAEAGASWWLEADWSQDHADVTRLTLDRLRAGPPRP